MLDFQTALAQKYALMGQQANAQTTTANAGARLSDAQAGNVGAQTREVAANAAATRGLQGAQTTETQERAGTIKPLAQSQIGLQTAQGGLLGAQTGETEARTATIPGLAASTIGLQGEQGGLLGAQAGGVRAGTTYDYGAGYAHGIDRVPGMPTPGVDSVKANLSPNEAVLNEGGADTLGRGLIDFLNAIGNVKMGTPPDGGKPAPAAGAPQGFAKGTSKVSKGKDDSGQTNALMALLQSMGAQGGGGQPMAGPPGAMPMGMPPRGAY